MKTILLSLAAAAALLMLVACSGGADPSSVRIGILQTASHPALDQARDSFMNELEAISEAPIIWVVQNAEGSMAQMATIARSYGADKAMQQVYAIGTPAVQVANRLIPDRPILYSAVSDPEALQLGPNVCGTSDKIDVAAQAAMIRQMLPEAASVTIALNPGEHNSVIQATAMEAALHAQGLRTQRMGVNVQSEILSVVSAAARDSDVLLVPADNLLVGAMPLLASAAVRHKIPLVASDTPSARQGALIARGVDYGDCGARAANLAYRLLTEEVTPKELGNIDPENRLILVNERTREALGILLPQALVADATLVTKEEA